MKMHWNWFSAIASQYFADRKRAPVALHNAHARSLYMPINVTMNIPDTKSQLFASACYWNEYMYRCLHNGRIRKRAES